MILGAGSTTSTWSPVLLRGLARSRPVVTFDIRGTGLSTEDHPANYTMQEYAESTVDLIDALGLDAPDLFAWSLGGAIALTTAVSYPGVFAHMVLAGSTIGGDGRRRRPDDAVRL